MSRKARRQRTYDLELTPKMVDSIRPILPRLGDDVVATIIAEVPSYKAALAGPMGETIRTAVSIALSGFLDLAAGEAKLNAEAAAAPPALQGAYDLGRGEARSGRTTEALLAAYRIGARVAWREMSLKAVAGGMEPADLVEFAALVFTWIDEVSDASVAGHSDELSTAGRVQRQLRERLAHRLLDGADAEVLDEAALRASWTPPETLTAVLLPDAQVGSVLSQISQHSLELEELPEVPDFTLLLVPDVTDRRPLLRVLEDRGAYVGPARPWREARVSYDRARRAAASELGPDTDQHLVELVLDADPEARADLQKQVLAPLADLRPGTAEKLKETLRAWLLHQGRRDDIATALYVHPQTVRYRLGQLRDAYGERLGDPRWLLALTVALG